MFKCSFCPFSPISIDKKITYISSSYPDKRFEFTPFDTEVIKLIGIARNSYYKYKRELIEELNG